MELGRSSCSQLPGRCTSAPAASARAGGGLRFIRAREAAAPLFFWANPAREQRGYGVGPIAGRSRGKPIVLDVCSLRDFSRALYPLAGGAERRAGFLFAQFAGGAGRWPSYGVIGDQLAAAAAS